MKTLNISSIQSTIRASLKFDYAIAKEAAAMIKQVEKTSCNINSVTPEFRAGLELPTPHSGDE